MEWQDYLKQHRQRFIDELLDFIKIPSISAQTEYVSTGNSSKKIQSTDKVCEISDMSQINNLHFEQEPLSKNESYFFHTLLLHSSEKNTSDSARITMQIRFDDLLCEDSFNRNFPEGRNRDDLFSNNFSEYVVEN